MPGNKHTLRISHSEFQKLKGNLLQSTNQKKIPTSKRCEGREDESYDQCIIFLTFYISDNRGRDLDGMVSTVFDCLVRSGKIPEDKRQVVPMFITDYEICRKGSEGFRARIVTNENK